MPKIKLAHFNHHASLLLGTNLWPELKEVLASKDVYYTKFDSLGINDARELRERGQNKSWGEGKQYLVIEFGAITTEAQNALLKTIEELTSSVQFFFLTSSTQSLLPTFLSRVEVFDLRTGADEAGLKFCEEFVSASPEMRLELVQKVIEKVQAIEFLNNLEQFLSHLFSPRVTLGKNPEIISFFDELRRSRQYLSDKAGLPKLILEHLALVLPTSKQMLN